MHWRFMREVAGAGLAGPVATSVVTEAALECLPPVARKYLEFMRVVGRRRDWSFRAHLAGRFRPAADAAWQNVQAWQYNVGPPDVARMFYMTLKFFGVPVLGRDTYIRGTGRMRARALGVFTVADGCGPEFDLGELATWLNDAVLIAPSMLLTPAATWTAVDGSSFGITLTDAGHTVSARVSVDERGAPVDFRTDDRWFAPVGGRAAPARTPWTTPVQGWTLMNGRMLPTAAQAVWKLPAGDLPYAEIRFRPGDILFNVPAARSTGSRPHPTDRVSVVT